MFGFGPFGSAPFGAMPQELIPDILELVEESNNPLQDVREILLALKGVSEIQK
jgi:hypothetical protein